jgi:hypothetical protein
MGITNKPKFLAVLGFIAILMGTISAEAMKLYQDGNLKVTPKEHVIRVAIGNGSVNLLEGQSTSTIGINTFNGQKLNDNRSFIADSITVNYGVAADGTTASNVAYTTALPAALRAGALVFKQDNEVIFRVQLASVVEAKSTDARFKDLEGFQLLREDITTEVYLEMPAGADLAPGAGNSGYIEVIANGFETSAKRR